MLVSGAIGLQSDRGDQLVIESLPFESTLQSPAPVTNSPAAPQYDFWKTFASDPRYVAPLAALCS